MSASRTFRLLITGALAWLGWASCAKDLEDIEFFPCAKDGTCPEGWLCVPSTGCAKPEQLPQLVPFPCTETKGCPEGYVCVDTLGCLLENECSVMGNDCGTPERPKCTLVEANKGTEIVLVEQCVPGGDKGDDDECTETGVGFDDCGPGLLCGNRVDMANSEVYRCRRYCQEYSDCSTLQQECASLGFKFKDHPTPEMAGYCDDRCDRTYSAQACPEGMSCLGVSAPFGAQAEDYTISGQCFLHGDAPPMTICETLGSALECQFDHVCIVATDNYTDEGVGRILRCTQQCTDVIGCADGKPCVGDHAGEGFGYCTCVSFGDDCGEGNTCDLSMEFVSLTEVRRLDFGGGHNTHCRPAGTAAIGEECVAGMDDCGKDALCYLTVGGAACHLLCDDEHPCAEGTCHTFSDSSGTEWPEGVCLTSS